MPEFTSEALGAWQMLPSGACLRAALNAELESILPSLFGYHLLSVGCFANALDLGSSPVRHQIRLGIQSDAGLWADPGDLPLRSDSVDVVVLAQLLEFHDNPHRVLREAARVVIPEGALLVAGFNPYSGWGLSRLTHHGDPRYGLRGVSPGRVKDWLALLDLELVEERRFFFRPPRRQETGQARSSPLDAWGRRWVPGLGSLYLLHARKRVATVTPVRSPWTSKVIPIRASLVEPGVSASSKESCRP